MKFIKSEKAEAEVIGHVLILIITVLGISMIALYGIPAIYSLEDMANVKNVEQAFTVLDSRASRTILGESPLQITNINLGGGTLTVEPNSSNAKSYVLVSSQVFNVTIPMGKVKYQLGDRIIAYEGGGVWSNYPSGTVMLSPPEVHFNGYTLTLPVINLRGTSSVGGKGTATVSFKKNATDVQYPIGGVKTNPVNYTDSGRVYMNITSDFYDAWAVYAESLGYTKVTTNSTTRTTSIELRVVPSTLGINTSLSNPITFRGVNETDPTPLENLSFRLEASGTNGLNLEHWQLRARSSDGKKELIFNLEEDHDMIEIKIGYKDTSNNYDKFAETWIGKGDANKTPIINPGGGSKSDEYADVNLINQSIQMEYEPTEIPSASCGGGQQIRTTQVNLTAFTPLQTTVSLLAGKVITTSDSNPNHVQTLFNVTQHYFDIMAPDIIFEQCGPSDPVDYGASTMLMNYTTMGALTYLHITENRADVTIS